MVTSVTRKKSGVHLTVQCSISIYDYVMCTVTVTYSVVYNSPILSVSQLNSAVWCTLYSNI